MFIQAAVVTNHGVNISNIEKGDGPLSRLSQQSHSLLTSFKLLASRKIHRTGMAIESDNLPGRSPYLVASIFLIAVVPMVSWLLQCNQRPKTFPPGPPTIPILGNLHQMPTKHIFLKFAVSKQRNVSHTIFQCVEACLRYS